MRLFILYRFSFRMIKMTTKCKQSDFNVCTFPRVQTRFRDVYAWNFFVSTSFVTYSFGFSTSVTRELLLCWPFLDEKTLKSHRAKFFRKFFSRFHNDLLPHHYSSLPDSIIPRIVSIDSIFPIVVFSPSPRSRFVESIHLIDHPSLSLLQPM